MAALGKTISHLTSLAPPSFATLSCSFFLTAFSLKDTAKKQLN